MNCCYNGNIMWIFREGVSVLKRILGIVCALLCLIGSVAALPVSAAGNAVVTAGTVTATVGDTVTVPVSISEVDDIGGIGLHIAYDAAALECVEATAQGIVAPMDMLTVNTEPVGSPNEIWLTGISLNGIKGSGDILHITFKVKADAANGLAKVGFTEKGQELVSSVTVTEMPISCVDGGVVISGGSDAPATTAAGGSSDATTAAKTDAAQTTAAMTDAATTTVQNDQQANENDDTSDVVIDLEPLEKPTLGTAVDIDGAVITDAQGAPTMVQGAAIRIGKVTGTPGDVVTVAVDISEVSSLTAIGINVAYDTDMFKFESGEAKGILADGMAMTTVTEREDGIVSISAVHSTGVSGSGAVAYLHFRVKNSAKNGEHELSFATTPVLMSDLMTLPVSLQKGAITVEGARGNMTTVWLLVALIVVAGGAVLFVLWRKKTPAKPKAAKPAVKLPTPPTVTEIDDDGFEETEE